MFVISYGIKKSISYEMDFLLKCKSSINEKPL